MVKLSAAAPLTFAISAASASDSKEPMMDALACLYLQDVCRTLIQP